MSVVTVSAPFGRSTITLETGRLARQAHGAVLVTMGDTVVLVTATGSAKPRPGVSFLPLTVEYVEKAYAAGKIPGGYFKREGRLAPWEVLVARLIDRPNRPLFPSYWRKEIQIIATVLSTDNQNDPAVCAMVGASAAVALSDIPYDGPAVGCRVARIDGEYVVNPLVGTLDQADLGIIVAATADAVVMVEGEAREVDESAMIDAIATGREAIAPIVALINEMVGKVGKPKQVATPPAVDIDLFNEVIDLSLEPLADALMVAEKMDRYAAVKDASARVVQELIDEDPALAEREAEIDGYLKRVQKDIVRTQVLDDGVRIDGRRCNEVRPISCEVGMLPRAHGSALFTRGETQAIAAVTLGTRRDEQRIDNLYGDSFVPYMLHYNFPPFCVGEARMLRGASRREIGHGNLAHRGIQPILPPHEDFTYTIRIVSEVLESNGSSSMATVCAGSMALMNAGVPVNKAVAGIAMGLIQEDDQTAVLSDILGDEDHLGDMDFKVVGTADGITALQMDIKIAGLDRATLEKALRQARQGRLHILGEMSKAIQTPADALSTHAPRIFTIHIKPDRIRDIIGPGGKTIRGITEQTGASIDVDDTGKVTIATSDEESAKRAIEIIEGLTQEPEVGRIYQGVVRKITDFGAFVEILPGTDGLVHISELADGRVARVEDVLAEGDEVYVKCIGVDRQGKIRLSRKEALRAPVQN